MSIDLSGVLLTLRPDGDPGIDLRSWMGTQVLISACQRSYLTRDSMHQTTVYDHQLAVLNYLRGTVQRRRQEQYIWKWWRLPAWETMRGRLSYL